VISVTPPGVAVERGEDPVVDGSHGREEGGGVEDVDDDEYHRDAHPWCVVLVAVVNAMLLASASTSLLSLSVTVAISFAIAFSVVPFLVDCCISPHRHRCCGHCLRWLAGAIAGAIAATATVAFAITAAAIITAAINATAVVAVVAVAAHNCRHSLS
jgi:hypothetical protein